MGSMIALLAFGAVVFSVFFIFKQIQFFVQSVDLYKKMIGNQEKIIQELIKIAQNAPERQKIIAESKRLEAEGEKSELAARKIRLPTLENRNVCPSCYRDYSKYIASCEVCDCKLEACHIVLQNA